jgi:negative regulator of flagellin synthesis FlgM
MKIGPLDSKPPASPSSAERKTTPEAAAPQAAEASAKVALSPAASSLSVATGDAAFDTAKVERIAQAIRDGRFKVNAEVIADKLIINAEELLGPKSKPN